MPKIAGNAAVAAAIVMVTLLVGLVVAPVWTAPLTSRDAPTAADTDETPTDGPTRLAPATGPRIIPKVGVIPRSP